MFIWAMLKLANETVWKYRLLLLAITFGISTSVFACDTKAPDMGGLVTTVEMRECDPVTDSSELFWTYDLDELGYIGDTDYWAHWSGHLVDNPVLTGGDEISHFGLGLWQPNEEESIADMTYVEWLRSHGLQFSLGFGEPGKPRFRFDYQWHEMINDHVSFQVEVPF
ncbi:hypothetical protein P7F88_18015 [Vibrio hannami]|uniref:hypothetical protein n=1 Tax=Vibrio hannami TaxID=2717094 RepID=UPI00240F7833|nr:hypothetical protein [Vibrio hannami]MDG3087863.1 hypothetical protein [Vibrio hannami]